MQKDPQFTKREFLGTSLAGLASIFIPQFAIADTKPKIEELNVPIPRIDFEKVTGKYYVEMPMKGPYWRYIELPNEYN